jgi:hypothetical protein
LPRNKGRVLNTLNTKRVSLAEDEFLFGVIYPELYTKRELTIYALSLNALQEWMLVI